MRLSREWEGAGAGRGGQLGCYRYWASRWRCICLPCLPGLDCCVSEEEGERDPPSPPSHFPTFICRSARGEPRLKVHACVGCCWTVTLPFLPSFLRPPALPSSAVADPPAGACAPKAEPSFLPCRIWLSSGRGISRLLFISGPTFDCRIFLWDMLCGV